MLDYKKITTEEGMQSIKKYILSLGRYGHTPFIVCLYGLSEFSQAFCR